MILNRRGLNLMALALMSDQGSGQARPKGGTIRKGDDQ